MTQTRRGALWHKLVKTPTRPVFTHARQAFSHTSNNGLNKNLK